MERVVMKGWLWGMGSHTKTVVAILYWKEMGVGVLPRKIGDSGVFGAILGHFFDKTKVADRFSANKVGDEAL